MIQERFHRVMAIQRDYQEEIRMVAGRSIVVVDSQFGLSYYLRDSGHPYGVSSRLQIAAPAGLEILQPRQLSSPERWNRPKTINDPELLGCIVLRFDSSSGRRNIFVGDKYKLTKVSDNRLIVAIQVESTDPISFVYQETPEEFTQDDFKLLVRKARANACLDR